MYQNVRGLNTKLSALYVDSFNFNHHIIVFTETWIQNNINNSEILCNKYQIFRCDRFDKNKKRGGGVLIAVSMIFPSEQIMVSSLIEFVAVKIRLNNNKSMFISCSYVPPEMKFQSNDTYTEHLLAITTAFETSKSSDIVLAIGDFNLPSISWKCSQKCNYLVPIIKNGCVNNFIQSLLNYGLFQVNHIYNNYGKFLDLIFTNHPSEVSLHPSNPVTYPVDPHHPTIDLKFYSQIISSTSVFKNRKVYCYSKADYSKLKALISSIDWNFVLISHDFDSMIQKFYDTLHAFISLTVPKIFDRHNIGPPWNNAVLATLKNKKNKMYKKYKSSGSSINFCNYSIARSEYNIENKRAYNNYLIRMKRQFKSNPKSFYKFVKSKRRSSEFPKSMKFGSSTAYDDSSISNLFAKFFSTTYCSKTYNQTVPYPYDISQSTLINISFISESTVLSHLKSIKNSFSPGPDGIPSNILRNCADSLSYPLTIIFNESLRTGYLPPLWKESFIIPLFKSGSKMDVSNYRGIAKLSAIPKLLEKIITGMLTHQVSSLLSPFQHGFRKSRSTITNVLELTTCVNDGFKDRLQTDVVYTDFSKAFDKVNHELLLIKLNSMGFSNSLLSWLRSYLTNRVQRVLFKNSVSKNIDVISGVPQGSHLGPVLFTLFINDVPSIIQHSKVLMYADDLKIFLSFKHVNEHSLLQSDINNFSRWCIINLMELNTKKCKVMSFFRMNHLKTKYLINNDELDSVESITDLGILLDNRLNFRSHISMTINKAYGVLGFMKRWSKEFCDPYVTKQLYTSLVRPILEYGSIIWDPCYRIHINLIESVQKQFLLFCLRGLGWNTHVLPSYESRLGLIKLPTLKSRRTMLNISFLMNVFNGEVDSGFLLNRIQINVPFRNSRNYAFLNVNYFRTNYLNNDPFRRLCVQFNSCYSIIDFSDSKDSLKRNIILHLNR